MQPDIIKPFKIKHPVVRLSLKGQMKTMNNGMPQLVID